MADRPLILINLVVVPALERLVAKEMYGLVLDPADVLLVLDMPQTERLVPARREHVERYLPADRVRQAQVGKLLAQHLDELGPAPGLVVPFVELVSVGFAGVPADGGHVDHAVAELDEGAAHGGQALEFRDVAQDELGEFLVVGFADVLEEGGALEGLAEAEGGQAVLGEAEVEERCDGDRRGSELFLLFEEV